MSLCQGYKCSDDKNIGTVRLRNYSKINHENTKVRKHEIRHRNALSRLRADLENFEHRFSQIYTDNIIAHKFKNLCSSVSKSGNSYTIKLRQISYFPAQAPFQIPDIQHRIPGKQDHHQGVHRTCTSNRSDEQDSLPPGHGPERLL